MKVLPAALIAVSLLVLTLNQGVLDRYHEKNTLNRMVSAKDVPATLALTTFALGPMRSLVADVLWWRAIQQQDEGRYYDAMQLADWITKLQPTYPSVWVFHGWNVGYNISADFAGEEDSWRWVDRAIRLLRDEGLRYNPNNRHIRHELASIFYDKIGNNNDVHGAYYRNRWAFMMMDYFILGTRDELVTLANAARTPEELLTRTGVAEYRDAALRRGIDVLNFTTTRPQMNPIENLDLPPAVARDGAIEIFRCYRRIRIERDLKLDPDRMLFIDKEYGPLDWRLHQAHAIYWVAEDSWDDFVSRSVNYSHIIRQSMMSSFRDGKLLYLANSNSITFTNNLAIIDRIHAYMEILLREQYNSVTDGHHREFLKQAVTVLYSYNRMKAARVVYEHYIEDYYKGQKVPTFETFIAESMRSSAGTVAGGESRTFIEATLYDSFRWLSYEELDRSNGALALAKLLYQQHLQRNEKTPLPPFEDMLAAARTRFAADTNIDNGLLKRAEAVVRSKTDKPVDVESFTRGAHPRPNTPATVPAPAIGPQLPPAAPPD